jgi:peptidoglycan hydrolase-like protein with peptidoglycan-binding domain
VIPGYEGPEALHLQRLLTSAGVYHGPLDGVFGKKSWYALSEFQQKNGLRPTGLPDRETMEKLAARAARTGQSGQSGQTGEERP